MKIKPVCLILTGLVFFGGCSYYAGMMRPTALVSHSSYVECKTGENNNTNCENVANLSNAPLDLDTFKYDSSETIAYLEADSDKMKRNRLQDVLIDRSNTACGRFLDELYSRVTVRKSILATTALLASAAGAIVTGENAQRILAGTSASAIGFDAIMDSTVLQNQMVTLLVSQIQTARKGIRLEIAAKREKEPSEYSIDEAILDVGRYHEACSFIYAVTELTKTANKPLITKTKISEELASVVSKRENMLQELSRTDLNKSVRQSRENELAGLDQRKAFLEMQLLMVGE